MAATRAVIWFVLLSSSTYLAQRILNATYKEDNNGICKTMIINGTVDNLRVLEKCVVIMGNLQIKLMERTRKRDFENVTFSNLREVTGYVVFYRVRGLESIGQLFPYLTRIRGDVVFYDFSLIVYDMPDLKEVGLYNLLKLDRGGVTVWAVPQACFVTTVNWNILAPIARRVLGPSDGTMHCTTLCSCTTELETNHCWNVRKCQRYLEGPGAMNCSEQCFGCRNVNWNYCLLCRNYTYQYQCVSKCPANTLTLPVNKYCITKKECTLLGGWAWNNTCVFVCPLDYVKSNTNGNITCIPCVNCNKTCGNLFIQSTSSIQAAERCVYIDGYLKIHVRSVPGAMAELRNYLWRIQNVSHYVEIYGSFTITSLDFLSSLRYIGGKELQQGNYSFIVNDMVSLQTLFTPNVTKYLHVERGTMHVFSNPVLCLNEIEKLQPRFPIAPDDFDVSKDTNGYSGGCNYISVGLEIRVLNESSALVIVPSIREPNVHYSILYIRLPNGSKLFVPETCSESEWHEVEVPAQFGHNSTVELSSLHPASTYALCIEIYEPKRKYIARSKIFNFTTPVGKPEPPFILELVASSSDVVVIRWVNHKVYQPHIDRYELDVTIVDIETRGVGTRDHCKEDLFQEPDDFRHAVVMRPPPSYDKGCESMCGVLSSSTAGALVEEYFDLWSDMTDTSCYVEEISPPCNSSIETFVRCLSLNISAPKNEFQVGNLAPFRDYRFSLRGCSKGNCSRSARSVVRTLNSIYADKPTITYVNANEFGYISVAWTPPSLTNGAILAYFVEVVPIVEVPEIAHILPKSWCVSPTNLNLVINYIVTKKYTVRVCSISLTSKSTCADWKSVKVTSEYDYNSVGVGFILGLLIFVASAIIGWILKRRQVDDGMEIYLLNDLSTCDNKSEPPSEMLTEVVL